MTGNNVLPYVDTTTRWHQCCCVMTVEGSDNPGRCPWLAPSDVPFCDDCAERHPNYRDSVGVTIDAVL